MLTRAKKTEQVAELKEKFARASSVYLADYRGIDVPAVNSLRSRIHAEGGGEYEYRVTKNTLLRLAVEGSEAAGVADRFRGPTAVAFAYGDPIGLAKILSEFAKQHDVFQLKGGVLEGRTIDAAEIGVLATLPPLEALRAQLVGLIQSPATKLARVLQAPAGQLARVVEARRAQLEEAGGSS